MIEPFGIERNKFVFLFFSVHLASNLLHNSRARNSFEIRLPIAIVVLLLVLLGNFQLC